jgi:hypothetical protein
MFEIPILWIPCLTLKESINVKIKKRMLQTHYTGCEICEIINNNRTEIIIDDNIVNFLNKKVRQSILLFDL